MFTNTVTRKLKQSSGILCLTLGLLAGFGHDAAAQGNCDCIQNGELTYAGSIAGGSGDMNDPWFPNTNVAGWRVSHGSPSQGEPAPGGAPNGIWMWSHAGMGEGVFTCQNFRRGRTYMVCFWVKNSNGITDGNLRVFAANGLTGTGPTFTSIPTPASAQLISSAFSHSATYVRQSYIFTADADYGQLWFYPFKAAFASHYTQQYELNIDRISVTEVTPMAFMPTVLVVPAGASINLPGLNVPCSNAERIWYSPSGALLGAGPIDIHNVSTATAGGYSSEVRIGGCEGCTFNEGEQIRVLIQNIGTNTSTDPVAAQISVAPNPAGDRAVVNVKDLKNARVVLKDMTGKEIATGLQQEEGIFLLQLADLAPGMYLVEATGAGKAVSTKLVKQ